MQKIVLLFLVLQTFLARGQDASSFNGSKVSYTIAISFNAVATPLHKPGNNFRNLGFKAGVELPWNSRGIIRQSVEMGYYLNRFNGRSLYVHSDFVCRPKIVKNIRADLHLGPGLGYIWHPSAAWTQKNGEWIKDRKGKLFGQIHAAFGLSYEGISLHNRITVSPMLQYEVIAIAGYNRSIPVFPMSMIHFGSRFSF